MEKLIQTAGNMVKEFHAATNNNWQEVPKLPSKERLALRVNLIMEEAHEFEKAVKDRDLVEMADGLIDLLYVTLGSLGELGLMGKADELLAEVHRSNMTKVCKDLGEARETVERYAGNGIKTDVTKSTNGYYIVYRVSDGKTLKSHKYSPANLKKIIADGQRG